MCLKYDDGRPDSEGPDQTAPSRSSLIRAFIVCSEDLSVRMVRIFIVCKKV